MLGFLTQKIGMTQVFDEQGNAVPVTVLRVLENVITQVKEQVGKDGYNAIQIGAQAEAKEYRLSQPEVGHCKKNNLPAFRILKEFRIPSENVANYNVGDSLDIAGLLGEQGTRLDATCRPKGKGTMGRIKRWNQHRRLMTHGTKHHRQIGSAGQGTTPGRVFPGKKMPGREAQLSTVRNLKFFSYDAENKLLLVTGSIPGHNNAIVTIKLSKPNKGWNEYALKLNRRKAAA